MREDESGDERVSTSKKKREEKKKNGIGSEGTGLSVLGVGTELQWIIQGNVSDRSHWLRSRAMSSVESSFFCSLNE